MSDDEVKQQYVVYLNDNAEWIATHGGPYAPTKAREVRESMEDHILRDNYRDWSIPEDAEKVETVTQDELRELKEIRFRTDGGTSGAETTQSDKLTPPIPPSDRIPHPEKHRGTRVVDSERSHRCDCGGWIITETVKTGQFMIAVWDRERFDPEEYQLEETYERTIKRERCLDCGWCRRL